MRKKIIPFIHLLRRKRRELYVQLRWRIRYTSPTYGGLFTSYQVLDEPDRPPHYNQWADVYFCGMDGLTIWNATVVTTAEAFWDKAEDTAHTRAWEMLTAEEQEREAKMEFEPVWHGGKKYFKILEREKVRYEKFSGMTFWEYQNKLTEEFVRTEQPGVFEEFATDASYGYGIGLHMVVHVDEINVKAIEQAIERFRTVGETDWIADHTIPRSELPAESRARRPVKEKTELPPLGRPPTTWSGTSR